MTPLSQRRRVRPAAVLAALSLLFAFALGGALVRADKKKHGAKGLRAVAAAVLVRASGQDLRRLCNGDCGLIDSADLRRFCSGDCGLIDSADARRLCNGDCGLIDNADLRRLCSGDCGLIDNADLRRLCRGDCGLIDDSNLRRLCGGDCGLISQRAAGPAGASLACAPPP